MTGHEPDAESGEPADNSEDDAAAGLTAYVIMRPADGSLGSDAPVTSENLAAVQPTPEAVAIATAWFGDHGFEVGPFVGISFAITAATPLFSQTFDFAEGGALMLSTESDPAIEQVAQLIKTVVVDGQAELFGP